jgi:hypothetical protein
MTSSPLARMPDRYQVERCVAGRKAKNTDNVPVIECPHRDAAEIQGDRLEEQVLRGVTGLQPHVADSATAVLGLRALEHAGDHEDSGGMSDRGLSETGALQCIAPITDEMNLDLMMRRQVVEHVLRHDDVHLERIKPPGGRRRTKAPAVGDTLSGPKQLRYLIESECFAGEVSDGSPLREGRLQ